jgi:hypothetical protein
MKKIPAWTYSQLDAFETCPRQFYHLRVVRDVRDPPNEHSAWGDRVHTALEMRVKEDQPLPEGMKQWEPLMQKIIALPGEKLCEQKMAINDAFQPAPWSDSWSRGKIDLAVVNGSAGVVLDYKTGKRKPSEQLELYAGYMFAHYPEIEKVVSGFVWLKERRIEKTTILRDDMPVVWNGFLPRYQKLMSAYERDSWPARPSGLCKGWCPCSQCEFNSTKK